MRVALFGGTGFVGSYLVDELIAAGHEPSLLVRAGSEHKIRQADKCKVTAGEISSRGAIADTLKGCNAVMYCIGILRENPRRGITFEEMQFAGARRVADAAGEQQISRFLLMSANGVKSAGTAYQETKYRAEQHVNDAGLEATVFRPSVIFGDPRGRMEIATQLYRDMVRPPLPAVGFYSGWHPFRGAVLMSPVHVRDVASAFVHALQDSSTIGKCYALGGPETLSWSDMLRRIAAATDRNKWIIPMPIALMRLAAAMLDWLPAFPVTRDQLTMLEEGNTAGADELQALTGEAATAFSSRSLDYLADMP